jgi:hypothetical protein
MYHGLTGKSVILLVLPGTASSQEFPAGPDNTRLSEHYNPAREIIGYSIKHPGYLL